MTEKASLRARVAVTVGLAVVCWVVVIGAARLAVAALQWVGDTLGVEVVVGLLVLLVVSVWRAVKR